MSKQNILLSKSEEEYIMSGAYVKDFPRLQKIMNEPLFTISDLGIAPRDATYWDQQEILPELLGKGARRKYTLTQSVWIRLITQMRRMNAGLPVIKSFKDKLFEQSIDVMTSINTPEMIAFMQAALDAQGINKDVKELLQDQATKDQLSETRFGMLEGIILSTIALKKRSQFLVGLGGDFMPYSVDKHDTIVREIPKAIEFIEAPHYCISVWIAILELMVDWRDKPFFEEASLLSEEEFKILKALRQPDVKSVTVRKINGEVDLLEKTVSGTVELGTRFMDIIMRHGYQNIEVKTRNGNIVHYENRILEKLKSTK